MKRHMVVVALSLAVSAAMGAACADESAPNRRGMERPPLVGGEAADRAEQRVNEAPKRDLPTSSEKEFPGQSRIDEGDRAVILLDVTGPQNTTAQSAPDEGARDQAVSVGATAPAAAVPAPDAPVTATPVLGTVPVFAATTTNGAADTTPNVNNPVPMNQTAPGGPMVGNATSAPAVVPAPNAESLGTGTVVLRTPARPSRKLQEKRSYDNQAYAVPGRAMVVPGTDGEIIPADWGDPAIVQNYPHRPYPNTKVTYVSGTTLHNPIYYGPDVWNRDYDGQEKDLNSGLMQVEDVAEIPLFFGETLVLPILMVIDPPLAQRKTMWVADDPLYEGKLPVSGPLTPAPYPGELRWQYPVVTTMPDNLGPMDGPVNVPTTMPATAAPLDVTPSP